MNGIKVAFAGGGKRMVACAEALGEKGIECAMYGFDIIDANSRCTRCTSLGSCLENASAVILPVPLSKDGIYLNETNLPVKLSDVFGNIPKEAPVFAGAVSDKARAVAREYNVELYDYLDNECLAEKNAWATAEGAIMLMMQNCDVALKETRCLVCGYGRIGNYTAKLLSDFGADVTVMARRELSRVQAENGNLKSISLKELSDNIRGYDFIINTVPSNIFTEKELMKMSCNQIYIELASAPFGIDKRLADKYNIEIVNGAALPSRYCPGSSGKYIAEVLLRELEGSGII